LNEQERFGYIFKDGESEYVANRFGWLDTVLLSDIRSMIDGGEAFTKDKDRIKPALNGSHGAGNVAISILVCTGLELVSALYTGETRYNKGNDYDAPNNVKGFINEFFPDSNSKEIAYLLWDGIRNGINHIFISKLTNFPDSKIGFKFVVDRDLDKYSYAATHEDGILITLNSIEFFRVLEQAIKKYKTEVRTNEDLQRHFIEAWESIEKGQDEFSKRFIERVQPEVKYLADIVKEGRMNLFTR
jgi:hypothetical protein